MDDFHDLLTDDLTWAKNFAAAMKILEDFNTGQVELQPVDDSLQTKRYVPCPGRRTALKITECWMCWCDWAWGKADLAELLAPEASAA